MQTLVIKASRLLFSLTLVLAWQSSVARSFAYGVEEMDTTAGPTVNPSANLKVLNLSSSDNDSPWVSQSQGVKTWRFQISALGCQSARVHLSSFRLQNNDRLLVYGLSGDTRVGEETFNGLGDRDGNVYTHRVWAHEIVLKLIASRAQSGFIIRYVQYGGCTASGSPNPVHTVCGTESWKNAVCYEAEYPDTYRLANSIVKLEFVMNDGIYLCNGFKTSDSGNFLTAYHCVSTQTVVRSTEVWVHFDSTQCHNDTGVARRILHGDRLVWTSGSMALDTTLFTVQESSEADQIPCLSMACSDPYIGQRINVITNPIGFSKKISIESDEDTGGLCTIQSFTCRTSGNDFCYMCDTAGASSGSPIFDFSSANLIGLHHIGGCYNSAVKIKLVKEGAGKSWGSCSSDPVVDAAVRYPPNSKTYLFRGTQYWRWNDSCSCTDSGYPKSITTYWKGLPEFLDAAVVWSENGKTYFFKGAQYWRYSHSQDRVDDGYPKAISRGWKGLPGSLDAAIKLTNGKTYFFKDSFYWRWNDTADEPDDGYPKPLRPPHWPGIPTKLDAAVVGSNNKAYIFKLKQYYEYGSLGSVYPRAICWGWKGMPCY